MPRYADVMQQSHFVNPRPNQRQFERRRMEARLAVTAADGKVYRGWCNDVSEGGVSATLPISLAANIEVVLELSLPTSDSIQLRAVVRHVNGFRYGFQFLTLSAGQRELISRFVADSGKKQG